MTKIGYCEIANMKLSSKSKRAVNDIQEIMEYGNMLSASVSAIPIFQIFMSPSATKSAIETGITITEYDWDMFANTLGSTSLFVRRQIYKIAEPMSWSSSGKEREFWRCISEAAL